MEASALNREEQKELMGLLGLDCSCWGALPVMRRAYLRKCLEYHPDKGGDEAKMKRMSELYRRVTEGLREVGPEQDWTWSTQEVPTYGTDAWEQWWQEFNRDWNDLFCDEEMPTEEDLEAAPQTTTDNKRPPDSQESTFSTPPKRPRVQPTDPPQDLKQYLSQALFSNKTMSTFLLYTTKEKGPSLFKKVIEKFHASFASRHGLEEDNLIFLMTPNKHRVSAITNFASRFCTVSFLIVRGVIKEYALYCHLCVLPYCVIEETLQGGLQESFFCAEKEEDTQNVSWKDVQEFAISIGTDDVHLLMGYYLEFSAPYTDCAKCIKPEKIHQEFHMMHYQNAQLFKNAKNQKNICQQAVDGVIAKRRVLASSSTREELLVDRFKYLFRRMDYEVNNSTIEIYMAGVAWLTCLRKDLDVLLLDYLKTVVENVPKNRYFLFKGPINTGKTTLAAAMLDLCGGKALNINLPFERINFELGMAIDQFTVLFEDVKGQLSDDKNLPTGQGVNNLDHLRDHLDGSIKVNLEKKHINKRTQIFPPGLVTMNDYKLPMTLATRFKRTVNFVRKPWLRASLYRTPELMRMRVLHDGMTLLLLLIWYCPIDKFHVSIQDKVADWKQIIDRNVSITQYSTMMHLCEQGEDILKGIMEEGAPEETSQDTGLGTETQRTTSTNPETGESL
ncbi:large T antigen [Lepus polyomavirus 1]|uniref:Large T antigen n=1 Tax=Lepus polyomavirus 1 TaxID=2716316 RepID=A0A6G7NNZ2_9POLY|nr:large T antigen [Lepus polyomavirus 1]QIJ55568.1 large T antigen [Lepus polyomavirus 1]QIJ55573.1 large T antigen [Lepus polyomavirus 1]